MGNSLKFTPIGGHLTLEMTELPKDLSPNHLSGRRFLLVDDNELNREIAREILTMYGADVDESFDGTQTLETFITHPINYKENPQILTCSPKVKIRLLKLTPEYSSSV